MSRDSFSCAIGWETFPGVRAPHIASDDQLRYEDYLISILNAHARETETYAMYKREFNVQVHIYMLNYKALLQESQELRKNP